MALKEYKPGSTFLGCMGRTLGESEPAWPAPMRAKEGAPNVLFIVLDDTGFAELASARSSTRQTSTGWPTTASATAICLRQRSCSPTSSCLLTGRNYHSSGNSLHHRELDGFRAG